MIKPAYLVEGDLEQKFIQSICPGFVVQRINCNGRRTSIEAIAKRVGSLGRLLHKRCSVLIVVFDREAREKGVEALENEFLEALVEEKIDVPVIVGIPDRNVEAWILADSEMFLQSSRISGDIKISISEGQNGKSIIKKALGDGRNYVETIDGVAWLKAARPEIMRANSVSFSRLFSRLSGLECRWLKQLQLGLTSEDETSVQGESPSEGGSDPCLD